jgi:hypothetical protein
MATPTPPPQIGSLDFKEIKQNLINYLQGQSIIQDYNFEGSVVQTLIDLLAYNTFYYAYYTNMIASEMFLDSAQRLDSIISLVKPLGYTISGKRSSRAKINLSGVIDNYVPEHSIFFGINEDGIQYTFYTLEDTFGNGDSDVLLSLVEGSLINNISAISSVDLEKQKYYILDPDIDISTIRVTVNGEVWKLKGNIGILANTEDKIYFVERINSEGFAIQFGIENTLGKSLLEDDDLEIRYLRSSGKKANTIYVFSEGSSNTYTCGVCSIDLESASSSGLDEPSIPLIKFLAPKYFAAQNRAVTKNDYNGLLLEMNLISDQNDATIFGGEELYPPKYGRVFLSLSNTLPDGVTIEDVINKLRENSVITIFPEYVAANYINIFMDFSYSFKGTSQSQLEKTSTTNSLKSFITSEFISQQENKFNAELDGYVISSAIQDRFPLVNITADDFSFFFRTQIPGNSPTVYFNLGNKINIRPGTDNLTISSPFINDFTESVVLKIITTPATNRSKFLNIIQVSSTSGQPIPNAPYSGKVIIDTGVIEIPKLSSNPYVLTIPFKDKIVKSPLNNITNFITNVATIK